MKEKGGGSLSKYDIFETLYEPLLMPQCIFTQHNHKEKNINKEYVLISKLRYLSPN
jgi:hypothetical protein